MRVYCCRYKTENNLYLFVQLDSSGMSCNSLYAALNQSKSSEFDTAPIAFLDEQNILLQEVTAESQIIVVEVPNDVEADD